MLASSNYFVPNHFRFYNSIVFFNYFIIHLKFFLTQKIVNSYSFHSKFDKNTKKVLLKKVLAVFKIAFRRFKTKVCFYVMF